MGKNVANAIKYQQVQSRACGPPEQKSQLHHGHQQTRGSRREKGPRSADPPNTISQQKLRCGGQESKPDGRTHLQNCDAQERTNCRTTVQGTGETTLGVLLTSLWSPYLKNDIQNIEKVQRRVTRMIPSISALSYEETHLQH